MTPAIRARLNRHLERTLCPAARARARAYRRQLYASWALYALRTEHMRVLGARTAASGARNVFLGLLADDLVAAIEMRLEAPGVSEAATAAHMQDVRTWVGEGE